jgi:hypothetical protein
MKHYAMIFYAPSRALTAKERNNNGPTLHFEAAKKRAAGIVE